MNTSPQLNEIAAALSKAQGELKNVTKDAKNPHFKSDYATLDAITEAVRPVFAKHGLAIVQIPTFRDGACIVESLITHNSGQFISGESSAPVSKADAQGVGSATTYLRRYATAGIAALAQTDDDGNAAAQRHEAAQVAPPTKPAGYDKWYADLAKAAAKGTASLREVYQSDVAKPFRSYLGATNREAWEDLKTVAADADKVAHVA